MLVQAVDQGGVVCRDGELPVMDPTDKSWHDGHRSTEALLTLPLGVLLSRAACFLLSLAAPSRVF